MKKQNESKKNINESRRLLRALFRRKIVIVAVCIIIAAIICAIFAPLIAPYDPYEMDMTNMKASPSGTHLLGTDALGRDILSRIIYGTRASLVVAVAAVGIAATGGILLGLVAGYFRGIASTVIMRCIDALMSVPMTILALTIAALMGGGLLSITLAIGVSLTSLYARAMRGQVLAVKQSDYIMAERAHGASDLRIMFCHILPNCIPVLIVTITIQLGAAILTEAGLSYLGVGIMPPTPSWGTMIQEGVSSLSSHPNMSFAPGVAIFLIVFAFNMFGDGFRDAMDPKMRNKR